MSGEPGSDKQAEGKQEARRGSQEASGSTREGAAPVKTRDDPPGGRLREGRSGEEEVVMRVVTDCDEGRARKGAERAGVTAHAGEKSHAWSSNFKVMKKISWRV